MGKIHFIADLHLGHNGIAKLRGFEDSFAHDEYLVEQWNKKITKRDTVWIVGDITMEKIDSYYYLDQLKGIKNVIGGNHDQPQHTVELMRYINKYCGCFQYKGFWLTHIPVHPSELYSKLNIHGHVHEKSIPDDRYINVCCDVLDYTPISLEEIEETNKIIQFRKQLGTWGK